MEKNVSFESITLEPPFELEQEWYKRGVERLRRKLSENGLDASVVFPSGIIGPGDSRNGSITHMLSSFIAGRLPVAVKGGYDFVDVRDVVRAYYMLLEKGTPGEIYNICSGNAYRLSDIIDSIAGQVGVKVTTRVNPEFVRPDDHKEIVGSAYNLESELGWKPVIDIKDTLRDMIAERS